MATVRAGTETGLGGLNRNARLSVVTNSVTRETKLYLPPNQSFAPPDRPDRTERLLRSCRNDRHNRTADHRHNRLPPLVRSLQLDYLSPLQPIFAVQPLVSPPQLDYLSPLQPTFGVQPLVHGFVLQIRLRQRPRHQFAANR